MGNKRKEIHFISANQLKINKFYNVSKFYALWIKLLTYPPLIHHKNNVSTICGYQNFNRWITIKKPLFIEIFLCG